MVSPQVIPTVIKFDPNTSSDSSGFLNSFSDESDSEFEEEEGPREPSITKPESRQSDSKRLDCSRAGSNEDAKDRLNTSNDSSGRGFLNSFSDESDSEFEEDNSEGGEWEKKYNEQAGELKAAQEALAKVEGEMEEMAAKLKKELEEAKAELIRVQEVNEEQANALEEAQGALEEANQRAQEREKMAADAGAAAGAATEVVNRLQEEKAALAEKLHQAESDVASKVEVEQHHQEVSLLQNRVSTLESRLGDKEKELVGMAEDSKAIKEELQTCREDCDGLASELEETHARLAEAQEKISATQSDWTNQGREIEAQLKTVRKEKADADILLEELDGENKGMVKQWEDTKTELSNSKDEVAALSDDLTGARKNIAELEAKVSSLSSELTASQQLVSNITQMSEAKISILRLQIQEANQRAQELESTEELSTLQEKYDELVKNLNEVRSSLQSQVNTIVEHSKNDKHADRASEYIVELSTKLTDSQKLISGVGEKKRRISELQEQLSIALQLKRTLHSRIQELRGNFRVCVRTRPFLSNDGASSSSPIDISPDGESLTIVVNGEPHSFNFDKVFAQTAEQEDVFNEVSGLVQSAIYGKEVWLFSYGQSGSGKTHTMQGEGNGERKGIIPRAAEQILDQAAVLTNEGWTYTLKASFLEIYLDELNDLLCELNSDGTPRRGRKTETDSKKISIKMNKDRKFGVDGINEVDINVKNKAMGIRQLKIVMAAAAHARRVAKTNMNSQSSRSHSVFKLHLCGSKKESDTTTTVHGVLNICDLAGSERLVRSGAGSNADRLKETRAINKSLSCLRDVFKALSDGSTHVPFRNSKLTHLLENCFRGDGEALMFVNLSPTVESSSESLYSLRFAELVNQVELKNVQYSE